MTHEETDQRTMPAIHLAETIWAAIISFLLHPATIAAIGPMSNGGLLGLGLLLVASGLGWMGYSKNKSAFTIKNFIQLPMGLFCTFMTVREAYCWSMTGWWLGF